jgi:acetyl esterase/lipase
MQKNIFFSTVCFSLLVLLCLPELTPAAQDQRPKVLIIGDSISIGYTNQVAELLKDKATVVRPRNENGGAINCESSEMGISGIDQWLGDTSWDVIHFNWGLWDICYRQPDATTQGHRDKVNGTITATPEQYEANLRQLVARLKATGATLIWAGTTPVPDEEVGRFVGDEVKYNAIAANVMAENRIAVDDLYAYMRPKAAEYWQAPGNVHYTKDGSAYLAKKVAAMIECALGPVTLPLWPAGAPGALGEEAKDKPAITVYLPMAGNATGAAVAICPGGGYAHLAMDHEGEQIAAWLNSFGVAGIVVDYRHRGKGYGYPAPLDDAQRAMRLIRSKADLWGIDADNVGVLGFSAGGHLASTVTTLFDKGYGKAGDAIDQFSSRPDFSVLCYPVISMDESMTHKGSKKNLLGKEPDPALVTLMSTEFQITEKTPPTFLMHANDDQTVLPENSIAFYTALRKANVKAEMHIYEKGGHGFGPGQGKGPVETWPDVCRRWIEAVTSDKKQTLPAKSHQPQAVSQK